MFEIEILLLGKYRMWVKRKTLLDALKSTRQITRNDWRIVHNGFVVAKLIY